MKGRNASVSKNRTIAWIGVACVCLASHVLANTTNDFTGTGTYTEDFESIARDTLLTGSGGWYGVSNAVKVVEGDPGWLFNLPLPGSAHTNALELTEAVSNIFVVGETEEGSVSGSVHNPPWVTKETYIDMMVNPVPRDSEPTGLDSNVQVAVYLDSEGYLNIYHRYFQGWNVKPDPGPGSEAEWTRLTDADPIPTNVWFRLTITMGYLLDPWGPGFPNKFDTFYQVQINGEAPLEGPLAVSSLPSYDALQANSGNSHTGSWFLVANTTLDEGNLRYWLSSIATEGPGMIDDLVVVTDSNNLGQVIETYGVDAATYGQVGISDPGGDDDGDGYLNWEELVAGTDPGNKDSVFEVTSVAKLGGASVVTFSASNAYNVDAQVTMLRTTNDLATATSGDWQPIGNVPAGDGEFTDNDPPEGVAYYKPSIGWTY